MLQGEAMSRVRQEVRVDLRDASSAPADAVAQLLSRMPAAAKAAAFMAVRGAGGPVGRPPAWLSELTDFRFEKAETTEDTLRIGFLVPTLSATAPEEYFAQRDLFRDRLDPQATAIDMLLDAVADVASENTDSGRYDTHVLQRIAKLQPVFDEVGRIQLDSHSRAGHPVLLDEGIVARARHLQHDTPEPLPVRIVGRLDMLRASTLGFGLVLEDETELSGVHGGELGELAPLLGREVVVVGKLVFRPSGRPLRIEAGHIGLAVGAAPMWRHLPEAARPRAGLAQLIPAGRGKTGIGHLFGTWPGDEDDAVIEAELARLS
jgi:hypothetical protein